MASTYTPIVSYTLGSAQSTVTFNSFSGYTDLRLVAANVTVSGGSDTNLIFRVNGDSGSNYSVTNLGARALSTTPFSARNSNLGYGNLNWYTAVGTQAGMFIADFQNYSNSTTYKTTLVSCRVNEGSGTYSGVEDSVVLWRNTNAITSLVLSLYNGGNIATGTFTLYGIKAA